MMVGRAETVGKRASALCAMLVFVLLAAAGAPARADDDHPLRPIPTGSPRETLQGFIAAMDDIYRLMGSIIKGYAESGRLYLNADERAMQFEIRDIAPRAVGMLDTSRIPPALKDTVSAESVMLLKGVLDRIDLPAMGDIPDRAEMMRLGQKKWRLPDTEIDIVLIEDGPRAGEYLFSADTVDRLPEFYARVKALPSRPDTARALLEAIRLLNPDRRMTLYDAYLSSPAALSFIVPPRWLLEAPLWVKSPLLGIAAWQWLGLGIGLVITALLVFLARRLARRMAGEDRSEGVRRWSALPIPLMIVFAAGIFLPVVFALFRISGQVRVLLSYAQTATLYLAAAWACVVVAVVVSETIVSLEHLQTRSLDSQLIRLAARLLGVLAAIGVLVHGADDLGLPAYSVIAGLGVGGLAVALAARDSIANLFGSLLILFERPFRIGHYIKVGATEGTVENVGFRSTRIRTLDNSLVSIPNSAVVNTTVENLTEREMRRQRFFVQVTYDTPREKLEALVAGIRQLILDNSFTNKTNFQVCFYDFNESSLDILVMFYLTVADYTAELQEREAILLQIMGLAEELGADFAFPTRTLQIQTEAAAAEFAMPATSRVLTG